MDGSEPRWDADANLDRVYRRGRQLKRRHRLLAAAAPAALAVLTIAGFQGLRAAGPEPHVRTVAQPLAQTDGGAGSGSNATTSTTTDGTGAGTNTQGSSPGQDRPGARPPGSSPSTTPGSPGNPTATVTSQVSSAGPTTTVVTACAASDVDYATSTNKSSYSSGQSVTIYLVLHNHSNQPCDGPTVCGGVGPWAEVINATTGAQVWHDNPIAAMCTNPPPQGPRVAPGQTTSYVAGTWNQTTCTTGACSNSPAPAGTYRAVAHKGNVAASPATFKLTG